MNELDDETLHLVRFEHDDLEVIVLDLEVPEPSLPELTASEREVALAVADGMSNAEVAEARGVSLRTVANQLRSIFAKLGVSSRWDLARLLVQRSLEDEAPLAAPTVITSRPRPSARSGLVNSPATTAMLRATYEGIGICFDATRRELDVDYVDGEALLREDYCALFDGLAALTGRPGFGLDLARAMPAGSLGLMEWLSLSAPTLGDALGVVSDYGDLLHDGGKRVTRTRGDQLVVGYWVEGMCPPRAVLDWAFGCLYERLRENVPERPIEVSLQYDDPRDGLAEALFGCEVQYGAATNELVLPRGLADHAMPHGDTGVHDLLKEVAYRRVAGLGRPAAIQRVRRAIACALDHGDQVEAGAIARRFGMSRRSFLDALQGAHTSFEQLVDEVRVDRLVGALEARRAAPVHVLDALRGLGA